MGQGFISKYILRDIADYIRVRRGIKDEIAPVDMRSELEKIPTYEEGKKDAVGEFWDTYQQNGERTDYRNAFFFWDKDIFDPKYDLKPIDARQMFSYFLTPNTAASLTDLLNKAGVVLDTSECTQFKSMFYASKLTEIPNIDVRKALDVNSLFWASPNLKKVEMTVAENTVPNYTSVFATCKNLETLIIHGKFDKSIDLGDCTKLTKQSVDGVIDALSANAGETLTLPQTAESYHTADEWAAIKSAHSIWAFVFR